MTHFQKSLKAAVETFQSLSDFEEPLGRASQIVLDCLTSGGKLLLCGNGGSASDSSHIATEFMCRFRDDRRPWPAVALTVDGSLLTAVSNDYTYQDVFSRQVAGLARPGDVLIALTTSGKSRNILTAIEEARRMGVKTIAFLGKGGGFTAGAADLEFIVGGKDTARIQEAHKFLLHVLCELVDEKLPGE